jgi:hypothetical protein
MFERALAVAQQVTLSAEEMQKLAGPQVGEQLRRRRIEAIAELGLQQTRNA